MPAVNDFYTTPYNTALVVPVPGVLINDTGSGPLTVTSWTNPDHGILIGREDGSFTYVPNSGYFGGDLWTYVATDGINTSTGIISVVVQDPPVPDQIPYRFPNDQLAYVPGLRRGAPLTSTRGTELTVYLNEIGPDLAPIKTLDHIAIAGSKLTITEDSLIPLFYGPGGVTSLWIELAGQDERRQIYASASDRLDEIDWRNGEDKEARSMGQNALTGIASLASSISDLAASIPTNPGEINAASVFQGAKADTAVQPAGLTSALATKADLVSGRIPAAQLPSFVDDVLESANQAAFPATGESGKIYVALDTNKTYRWSGAAYVEIATGVALGSTSSTAFRGDQGLTSYNHSQATGNPHGTTVAQISGLQTALDGKATAAQGAKADGAVQVVSLNTTGSAPSIGTAGSSIQKVQDGDLFMAATQYRPTGTSGGGALRDVQSTLVKWRGTQTVNPTDPAVGTAFSVDWRAIINSPGGLGPSPSAPGQFGPRGAGLDLSGLLRYATNQTSYGFGPITAADVLAVSNAVGDTARTLVPSWGFMHSRLWIADGATVTLDHNDMTHGGAAFIDTQVFGTVNGGTMTGTTNGYEISSFVSAPAPVGEVVIPRRVGFDAMDLRGNDHVSDADGRALLGSVIGPIFGGTASTVAPTVAENIGVRIRPLTRGTRNIGLLNGSSTVETPQAVTISDPATTITRDATTVHISSATNVTLSSTPTISTGVDGQRITIVNVGAGSVTFQGSSTLAGSGIAKTVTLESGDSIILGWSDGAWRERSVSLARRINRIDQWMANGLRLRVTGDSLGIHPAANVGDTYSHASMGSLFGSGFLAFGSGSTDSDIFLRRASAGVVSLSVAALSTGDGTLALGRARLKTYTSISNIPNPHTVGDIAVVAGKLNICTTAGSPGAWTIVGQGDVGPQGPPLADPALTGMKVASRGLRRWRLSTRPLRHIVCWGDSMVQGGGISGKTVGWPDHLRTMMRSEWGTPIHDGFQPIFWAGASLVTPWRWAKSAGWTSAHNTPSNLAPCAVAESSLRAAAGTVRTLTWTRPTTVDVRRVIVWWVDDSTTGVGGWSYSTDGGTTWTTVTPTAPATPTLKSTAVNVTDPATFIIRNANAAGTTAASPVFLGIEIRGQNPDSGWVLHNVGYSGQTLAVPGVGAVAADRTGDFGALFDAWSPELFIWEASNDAVTTNYDITRFGTAVDTLLARITPYADVIAWGFPEQADFSRPATNQTAIRNLYMDKVVAASGGAIDQKARWGTNAEAIALGLMETGTYPTHPNSVGDMEVAATVSRYLRVYA